MRTNKSKEKTGEIKHENQENKFRRKMKIKKKI